MNMQDIRRLALTRWPLILVTLLVCELGAFLYTVRQQHIYQASATVFVHPANTSTASSSDVSSNVQLLAYSSFTDTFNALSQSQSLLKGAGGDLGLLPGQLSQYTVISTTLPGATVLQISVQGPDPVIAASLANKLVVRVGQVASKYYPIFALTQLDTATPDRSPIKPRLSRDLLYGGAAGLLAGIVLAVLTLKPAPEEAAASSSRPVRRSGVQVERRTIPVDEHGETRSSVGRA